MARHLEETAGLISRTDGTKDGALRSSSKGAKQGCKIYYVYLVRSASVPQQRYVGFTENLKQRIADHNAGQNPSTAPYRPWRLVTLSPVGLNTATEGQVKCSHPEEVRRS